jgi:glycosyltransferase involved in cell wall biosynthesis
VVLTVHNVNAAERDGSDGAFNRFTLRIQYALSHHLFVHTEQMKQQLMSQFGVAESAISIIPFGINDTVPNTGLGHQEARRRLGLASEDRVLLFFGNIAPYKGVEFLVDAFAALAGEKPRYHLVIAGRPKGAEAYWAEVQRRIRTSGIEDRVTERIEYIPDEDTEIYFKAADVLILPYTRVYQSGVLFLGYNFGLPAIASDVGSLREDIVEGRTGFVCRAYDARSLEAKIRQYFSCPIWERRDEARADIKRFADEKYSWTAIAAITKRVYVALLGDESKRRSGTDERPMPK